MVYDDNQMRERILTLIHRECDGKSAKENREVKLLPYMVCGYCDIVIT